MKDLMIFKNEKFGEVRTVDIEGKIYFVGSDVAKALGYSRPSEAVTRHCKGTLKHRIPTNGGMQKMNIIPEGDLYRLITNSELDSAQEFEEWVFDEVLPTIRQTGGYIPVDKDMSDTEIMARALLIAQNTIEKKDKLITELQPKADVYDMFVEADTTFGFRELRKELESALGINIKETDLKEVIRQKGWIGKTVKALSFATRNGYMVSKDRLDKFGNHHVQDRFTMKAREELISEYLN